MNFIKTQGILMFIPFFNNITLTKLFMTYEQIVELPKSLLALIVSKSTYIRLDPPRLV